MECMASVWPGPALAVVVLETEPDLVRYMAKYVKHICKTRDAVGVGRKPHNPLEPWRV